MVASGGRVAVGERTPCRLTITADTSSCSAAVAPSAASAAAISAAGSRPPNVRVGFAMPCPIVPGCRAERQYSESQVADTGTAPVGELRGRALGALPSPLRFSGWCFPLMEVRSWRFLTY